MFHTQDIEFKALEGMKDEHKGFKFDQPGLKLKFTPGSLPQYISFCLYFWRCRFFAGKLTL